MTSEEPNNNNLTADRIHIKIIGLPQPTVLAIPENKPNANAPVHLGVRLTNNSPAIYNFNFYGIWFPEIIAPDGEVLQPHLIFDDRASIKQPSITGWRLRSAQFISNFIRQPCRLARFISYTIGEHFRLYKIEKWSQFYLVDPEANAGASLNSQLFWCDKLLRIQLPIIDFYWNIDHPNLYWYFDLKGDGIYQLKFIYLNNSQTILGSDVDPIESQLIQECRLSQLASHFVNFHLVEPVNPDRTAVEIDGIQFETIVPDPVFIIPAQSSYKIFEFLDRTFCYAEIYVKIGIKITNNTENTLHFSVYETCIPELISTDGQIQEMGHESDRFVFPTVSDFHLVEPGKCLILFPECRLLCLRGNLFRLVFSSGAGGYWLSRNLPHDIYQFRFRYQKSCQSRFDIDFTGSLEQILSNTAWSGRVDTPFIELNFVLDSS